MWNTRPVAGRPLSSPEHRGGTFLTVSGDPPRRIHGEFWTSRDTKRTLDMDSHAADVAQTFADAGVLFVEASRAA
jgi:hypothetical protein